MKRMAATVERLEAAGCVIRPWSRDDAPGLVRWADNPSVSRWLRDRFPSPYRLADAEAFLATAVEGDGELSWAIEVGGEPIGGIGLIPGRDVERFSAEVGYWLAEPFWGRGFATAAVRRVVDHAFSELGLLRVWAVTFDGNPASARVLEKAGFELEGTQRKAAVKRGRIHDLLMWAQVNPAWRPPEGTG